MKRWQCSNTNCGAYINQSKDPNKQNRPCPRCGLAPPIIVWIES